MRRAAMKCAEFCCGLLLLVPDGVSAQGASAPQRVLLVDWNKGSIALLSTSDGTTLASYNVNMKADGLEQVMPSPDGTRIVLAHHYRIARPPVKAKITILDARTLQPVSTLDLGWGMYKDARRWVDGDWHDVWSSESFFFASTGRLLVPFPGSCCVKNLPMRAELVTVDLKSGQVIARRELGRPPADLYPTARTDRTVLMTDSAGSDSSRASLPHKTRDFHVFDLTLLDMGTLEVVEKLQVTATERPVLGPGGDLYFKEAFRDKTRLHLIDGSQFGKVANLDLDGDVAQVRPRGTGRAFLFTTTAKGKQGQLQMIRRDTIEATLALASTPRFVLSDPEHGGFFVGHSKALVRLNASFEKVGEIATESDEPKSLVISKNGRRAFLLYAGSDKVTTIDLPSGTSLATVKTGSGARKFLLAVEEAQARNDQFAYEYGNPVQRAMLWQSKQLADLTLAGIPRVDTDVLLHPDGRFAYVLNQRTSDVTIIEQETGKSVGIVGANGGSLRLFGPTRAACVSDRLDLIDLSTNKRVNDPAIKDLSRLVVSPDRDFILGLSKDQLVLLDPTEGRVLRSVTLAEPKRACVDCELIVLPPTSDAP